MYVSLTFIVFSLFTAVNLKELDDDMLLFWRRSGPATSKCEPFTAYLIDCNKCVCSAEGFESCTRMACFKNPRFMLLDESKNVSPVDKSGDGDSSD